MDVHHSLWAVLRAAFANTVGIRQTWEGTYSTSFISALQPAVFGEGLYGLTTAVLLAVLLLALYYFLKQALGGVLGLDGAAVTAAFGALGFVMIQFAPSAAEGFYWFNGGAAYTLLWSVMLFTAGVWLRFERASGRLRCILLYAALLLLSLVLGGAKYSTALYAALLAAGYTAWAFLRGRPKKWVYLTLTLALLMGLAFSASAPGNAVRAKTLSGGPSAPKAVLEAVYFGLAYAGHAFSLPLVAAIALVVVLAIPALRQSPLRFAHPVWATALASALYCAQFAPTLYTGNYLGDGRVLNTYFFSLTVTIAVLATYWAGFLLRRYGRAAKPAAAGGGRVKAAAVLLMAALLAVGCVAYHPDVAASYGPQNMAGGGALRSVLDGTAAAYDAAMDARDDTLNDPSQTDVTLTAVTGVPASFMGDALTGDNLDYVLSLYAEYYRKATVRLEVE